MKARIGVVIDSDLAEQIELLAQARGISRSAAVNRLLLIALEHVGTLKALERINDDRDQKKQKREPSSR